MASTAGLILAEAELSDASDIVQVFFKAFHTVPYNVVMMPRSHAQEEAWRIATERAIRDPMTKVLKVTDRASGTVIAMGRWILPKERDGDGPHPGEEEGRFDPVAGDEELSTPLFESFARNRRAFMGSRRHYYMELLMTDPAFAGRGAASLILKYGTDKADQDGLECYIDSSPRAKTLYERFGWVFPKSEKMPRYEEFGYTEYYGTRKPRDVSRDLLS